VGACASDALETIQTVTRDTNPTGIAVWQSKAVVCETYVAVVTFSRAGVACVCGPCADVTVACAVDVGALSVVGTFVLTLFAPVRVEFVTHFAGGPLEPTVVRIVLCGTFDSWSTTTVVCERHATDVVYPIIIPLVSAFFSACVRTRCGDTNVVGQLHTTIPHTDAPVVVFAIVGVYFGAALALVRPAVVPVAVRVGMVDASLFGGVDFTLFDANGGTVQLRCFTTTVPYITRVVGSFM
jgi:hypothetical protein